MKAVKINLAGRERYLYFSVEAMFQVQDQFGDTSALVETMKADDRNGFTATCQAAAILAEQGELARRSLGCDPQPVVTADEIAISLSPSEVVPLKLAIPAAIGLGYGREIEPENDEVDLYMMELNAQKKTR